MAIVTITAEAQQQFCDLPVSIQARVEKIFVRLERWPVVSGAKALSGNLAGHYRIRTGDYRVQFHIIRGSQTTRSLLKKLDIETASMETDS